jgi:hypothetical protein
MTPETTKVCSCCEIARPVSEDPAVSGFARKGKTYQTWCRECSSISASRTKANRDRSRGKYKPIQRCNVCRVEREWRAFDPDPSDPAQLLPTCWMCERRAEARDSFTKRRRFTREELAALAEKRRREQFDESANAVRLAAPITVNRLQVEDSPPRVPDGAFRDAEARDVIVLLGQELRAARAEINRLRDEVAFRDLQIEELQATAAPPATTPSASEAIAVGHAASEADQEADQADDQDDEPEGDFEDAADALEAEARSLGVLENEPPAWYAEVENLTTGQLPPKLKEAIVEASRVLVEAGRDPKLAVDNVVGAAFGAIKALPGDVVNQARVVKALARIMLDPYNAGERRHWPYEGQMGVYKARAGKVRILYQPETGIQKVPTILKIGYRKEVYGGSTYGSN